MKKRFYPVTFLVLYLLFLAKPVYAMHIMEGYLPLKWCIFWDLAALPFLVAGIISIQKIVGKNPRFKMILVLAGAFTFVLSALKLPSVTGSCSHPTGVGLGTILFGPTSMSVISSIVLLFQALLLAHGGITTLGANIFSMGIVGPLTGFGVYKLLQKLNAPGAFNIFLTAVLADLLTYVTTSCQLSLAFPSPTGGFTESFIKFTSIFAITQIPLAISEGLLTVLIFNILSQYNHNELEELNVITKTKLKKQKA